MKREGILLRQLLLHTVTPPLFLLQPPVLRRERVEEGLECHELCEGVLALADLPPEADHAVVQLLDRSALLHPRGRLQVSPAKEIQLNAYKHVRK